MRDKTQKQKSKYPRYFVRGSTGLWVDTWYVRLDGPDLARCFLKNGSEGEIRATSYQSIRGIEQLLATEQIEEVTVQELPFYQ